MEYFAAARAVKRRDAREIRGKPAVSDSLVWFGDEMEGNRCIETHLFAGQALSREHKKPFRSSLLQTMADAEFPHGRRYYTKSGYFKTLTTKHRNSGRRDASIPSREYAD